MNNTEPRYVFEIRTEAMSRSKEFTFEKFSIISRTIEKWFQYSQEKLKEELVGEVKNIFSQIDGMQKRLSSTQKKKNNFLLQQMPSSQSLLPRGSNNKDQFNSFLNSNEISLNEFNNFSFIANLHKSSLILKEKTVFGFTCSEYFVSELEGWHCCVKVFSLESSNGNNKSNLESLKQELEKFSDLESSFPKSVSSILCYEINASNFHIFIPQYDSSLYILQKDKCAFNLEQINRFIFDLIKAIDFFHKNKMIHQNINSKNVLFILGNIQSSCYLSEFGLVGSSSPPQSLQGEDWSDLLYALPDSSPSFQSDLFAFGMLIIDFITWSRPYFGLSVDQSLSNIKQKVAPTVPHNFLEHNEQLFLLFQKCFKGEDYSSSQAKNDASDLL